MKVLINIIIIAVFSVAYYFIFKFFLLLVSSNGKDPEELGIEMEEDKQQDTQQEQP